MLGLRVNDMQTSFPMHMLPPAPKRTSVLLSAAGLVTWLTALALAVAGPLLGFEIPTPYLLGVIVFSAAFSVLSLPRLIEMERDEDK